MHQLLRMLICHSVFKVQTHDLDTLLRVGTSKISKVAINQMDWSSDAGFKLLRESAQCKTPF